MIRVVYLGQKPVGDRCFELLAGCRDVRVVGVVTNTTDDVWWHTRGVRDRAAARGIPVVPNELRNEEAVRELVSEARPDALISVQHPWILPTDLIEAVRGLAFNLHAARLPAYGGHNSVNHVILEGETQHGATVHWMTAEADAGDVAFEESVPVHAGDTARELYERTLPAAERAFVRLLDALVGGRGNVPRHPLDGLVRSFPRSSLDAERVIGDPADAQDVDRRSRALFFPPFEPAYCVLGGRKHYVIPPGFGRYAHEFALATW